VSHKDTLAVALIDPSGRRRHAITVANTPAGHGQLVQWLMTRGPVERLGIEGAGGYGRAVALTLLAADIPVVEVPPVLTMREGDAVVRPAKAIPPMRWRSRGSPHRKTIYPR
jgi:transposase